MTKLAELDIENMIVISGLFGNIDENVRLIEEHFNVTLVQRDHRLKIIGEKEKLEKVQDVINNLMEIAKQGEEITPQNIRYSISLAEESGKDEKPSNFIDTIFVTPRGKEVKTKTLGQKKYVKAIKENPITFAIGPAGTGKTYIAVVMAILALRNKEIERIVLTRPAVEAGEKLGYLPGDLNEKVNPYLRPLYDALFDLIGPDSCQRYLERGIIEVAPLAYMRGRTLDNSFIILDEAQNTTSEQMKMFLTRLGVGSRAVITGDVTQIDLPRDKVSGIIEAQKILKDIKGIEFVKLNHKDVVRHVLVQKIIKAYNVYEDSPKG